MPPKSPKIPRPSNAFILYRIDFQREVTSRPEPYDSKGSNRCNEISKEAGASWRLEPAEVQAKYYRLAEEAKRQHARLYPGYKYVPSKSNKKGRKKQPGSVRKVTAVNIPSPSPSPLSSISAVSSATGSLSSSSSGSGVLPLPSPPQSYTPPRLGYATTSTPPNMTGIPERFAAPQPSQNTSVLLAPQRYRGHSMATPSYPTHGQSAIGLGHSTTATRHSSLQVPMLSSGLHRALSAQPSGNALELFGMEPAPPINRYNHAHGAAPMGTTSMSDLSDITSTSRHKQRDIALPAAVPFTDIPHGFDSPSHFALSNTELHMGHSSGYPISTSQYAVHTSIHRSTSMTVAFPSDGSAELTREIERVLTNNTMAAPSSYNLASSSFTVQGQMQASPQEVPWSQEYDQWIGFETSEEGQAADMGW